MISYKQYGVFVSKEKMQRFEELCEDLELSPEGFLECFIRDLCNYEDTKKPSKHEFAARAYYLAEKESFNYLKVWRSKNEDRS